VADLAVFSSWGGRCSDSPRAVFDELRRRGTDVEVAWIAAPGTELPDGVTRVAAGGGEEAAALAEARWIVSNDVLQRDFAKARGATYLQTWHGTPLKRIAFDVRRPRFPDARHHYDVELGRDVARWDVLLSPNAFCTDVLPRAFRFDGRVAETGLPRNDALHPARREATRRRARAALGIDGDTTVLLYAPTWRDTFSFDLRLDLDAVAAAAGDAVVLVRGHWLALREHGGGAAPDSASVRDVSAWPETSELLCAADALITDYSSVMFDFALTGRPIVLYAYDLDEYRDDVRGFYLDLEEVAPGPVARDLDGVLAAVGDLGATAAAHAGRVAALAARFGAREDGRVSARALDAMFAAAL
jgi:CDP-glycerol glycerophosphotransferase